MADLTRAPDDDALTTWRNKLAALEKALALATDTATKFKLEAQIRETKARIAELESASPVADPPADTNPKQAISLWVISGLFALGSCVGLLAGLSNAEGTGKHLMTLVVTFIGGTILSYAGLQWRRVAPRVDPARIGGGMIAFAIAVILGVALGIMTRNRGWLAAGPPSIASAAPDDLKQCQTELAACTGGTLRGDCLPADLIDTATGWDQAGPASARRSCLNVFTDYAPALAICGKAHLDLQDEIDDAVPWARDLIDLAVRLNPDAKYVAAAKERLP